MQFTDLPIVNFIIATISGAPFSATGSLGGFASGIVQFFTGSFER